MERDVKVGLVIGVLLIALVGIFWWLKSSGSNEGLPEPSDTTLASMPIVEPPGPPIGGPGGTIAGPGDMTSTTMAAGPGATIPPVTLPGPGPVVTPTTLPAAAARTHTVVSGDNFSKLAKQYYGDESKWKLIADANPAVNPNSLKIGSKLVIPAVGGATTPVTGGAVAVPSGTRKHTVAAGETLSTISEKYYGTPNKWQSIYDANKSVLQNPDRVPTGTVLTIP